MHPSPAPVLDALSSRLRPRRCPANERAGSQRFLDPQQAIVLGQPLGARHRADLDLAGGGGDGEVGDGRVLGLARAGRDDRAIAVAPGQEQGIERLAERAHLVDLDQDRVGGLLLDPPGKPGRLGREEVVADELDPLAKRLGQDASSPPSRPRPGRPRSRRSDSGRPSRPAARSCRGCRAPGCPWP